MIKPIERVGAQKRTLRSNFPDINRPSLGSIVWPQNLPNAAITEESRVTHEGTYVTVHTQAGEMPGTTPINHPKMPETIQEVVSRNKKVKIKTTQNTTKTSEYKSKDFNETK